MKLIEKIDQHRRYFTGMYRCESCGNIEEQSGCYDDRNFHDNVTTNWKCEKCGKTSKELGIKNRVDTKYDMDEIV